MKFSEQKSQLEQLLNELTTAENAETIAQGKKALEAMCADYETANKDAQEAKSALVRIVSQTPVQFNTQGAVEPTHEAPPPSMDEVIEQSLASVLSNRAKN